MIEYVNTSCRDQLNLLFFQLDISTCTTLSQEQEVRHYIGDRIKDPKGGWEVHERVFFQGDSKGLSSAISFQLEKQLIGEISKVYTYLKRFCVSNKVRLDRQLRVDSELQKSQLGNTLNAILTDLDKSVELNIAQAKAEETCGSRSKQYGVGKVEPMEYQEAEVVEETDFKNSSVEKQLLCKGLAKMMRCRLNSVFVEKYKLPLWYCNELLVEANFDKNIEKFISDKTLLFLKERAKGLAILKTQNSTCEGVLKKILVDIREHLKDAERTVSTAANNVAVMGKMLIEIEGYFKETSAMKEPVQSFSERPKIPDAMRQELLK